MANNSYSRKLSDPALFRVMYRVTQKDVYQ